MSILTAYVAEDEARARALLSRLIKSDERLLMIGSSVDGKSALDDIRRLRPQVLFLDINMPYLTGIDLVRLLDYDPVVIFTTAYQEHAVTAFELHALDYLLKPFGPRRFNKAVARALNLYRDQRKQASRELPVAAERVNMLDSNAAVDRIVVKRKGVRTWVLVSDINVIEACDDYARLQTDDESFLIQLRMQALEARLSSSGLVRVHRSWIVNYARISTTEALGDGRVLITMKNGMKVRSSRAGTAKLREVMAR